jgi:zinc protease
MLEHMLFKPTTGKGVKWKDLENKGAHLNATTWLDRTLYYFTLPSEYLNDMLTVEADRMRNTLLTDDEFMPERANVLSEYEIQNSTHAEVLAWNVNATAFQNHGYHHDTIGWRTDIENYTTERLKRFYDRYYWPNNATLIVAGDIPEPELVDAVVNAFGHLSSHTIYTGAPRIESEQHGLRRTELVRETPLRVMYIAYKAPAFGHPDWLPLSLGTSYLTTGETSPLFKRLVDTGLVNDVSASLYPTHDPYLAYFTLHANEKTSYEAIERAFLEEIRVTLRKPISDKKLKSLKESLLAEEAKSRDGSRNIALTLSEYVATGDWRRYPDTFRTIEKITKEDVERVLKQYLTLDKATIGTLNTPQ